MREILFRGKDIISGAWVQGFLMMKSDPVYENTKYYFILRQERNQPGGMLSSFATWREVEPSTVGQYAGLADKNGKKIFEGDIVKMSNGKVGAITYVNCCAGFGIAGIGDGCSLCVSEESERLIIGNIHDNPELLEVQND